MLRLASIHAPTPYLTPAFPCEIKQIPSDILEQHSRLCAELDDAARAELNVDARLLRLADHLEHRAAAAQVGTRAVVWEVGCLLQVGVREKMIARGKDISCGIANSIEGWDACCLLPSYFVCVPNCRHSHRHAYNPPQPTRTSAPTRADTPYPPHSALP